MIAITGATGFIGSAILWQLNELGHQDIVICDRVMPSDRPGLLNKRSYAQFYSKDQFLKFLEGEEAKKIKWIVHMGACSSTTEMNREFLAENNTLYTQKLFQWCTQNKVSFIYASSAAVYGDGQQGFDDSTDPEIFRPLNPYGESKLNFDRWVVRQNETPPLWMGLRFFNVYGPNEYFKKDMNSVVFKAYNQVGQSGSLKLFRSHHKDYEDGEQLRDFIYVKDITRWIAEIIDGKGLSGIYNMGFGKARTWNSLASSVFSEMNKEIKINWIDVPEAIRARYQYYTKAKMDRFLEMGFSQPKWNLEEGVADYVRYLQKEDSFL